MSEPKSTPLEVELTELKLRALAEFAAGAGHEINNPVATIVGYAQQLMVGESDPDRRQALATIGAQAYRIRDMIGDVMLFARPPAPNPESVNAASAIREVVEKLADVVEDARANVQLELSDQATVYADPTQFRIVISAVFRNALEALPAGGGGHVQIVAKTTAAQGRGWTQITITDNGRSLSDDDREHLFDPFYSGRQAGRGLGFGLPKAWRIVTVHGGQISVETPHVEGVEVVIRWPAGVASRTSL
ncbi:MAG: HAMP domain-containing histidine kinase [Planctomycetes bacterium]|nr:HAMP domain-containing histidine kinase [Planctomycetota bacterium]